MVLQGVGLAGIEKMLVASPLDLNKFNPPVPRAQMGVTTSKRSPPQLDSRGRL